MKKSFSFSIIAMSLLLAGSVRPSEPQGFIATLNVGSFQFQSNVSQADADNKRDNALIDFCKALRLDIYQSDGVTVDPTKVGPAIRSHLKSLFKGIVVHYRAENARKSTANSEAASLNPE